MNEREHRRFGRGPGFGGRRPGRERRNRIMDIYRENKEHKRRMEELGRDFHPPKKLLFLFFVGIHLGIAASWAAAYAIMAFIYRTWFPEYGHSMFRQYLVIVLTLTLMFVVMYLIKFFIAPVRRQMEWFVQMIGAMKQLSKGDFSVNLDSNPRYMGQFAPLVRSFNEMVSDLNRMEQMRQEFISNVSHEFQSPLTSIAGFAKALQREDLPADTRKHYLEIIETESKRLSRMSDNLLKLTSLESNRHPFEKKPYRLDRQLRHLILACEPLWRDKDLEMDVELPETTIVADEDLMSQVWLNLLHNAIKFAPSGGTIGIRLSQAHNRIRVNLTDNGPGLSAESLPRVFERFYKEDKARDRSAGGSGLGLSIVKRIVGMHGGEAFAANRPSGGASFTVELPGI